MHGMASAVVHTPVPDGGAGRHSHGTVGDTQVAGIGRPMATALMHSSASDVVHVPHGSGRHIDETVGDTHVAGGVRPLA